MRERALTALARLFTSEFGPRRAEAFASEITGMAAKLGAHAFRQTLKALADGSQPDHPGIDQKTLIVMVEGIFDQHGPWLNGPGPTFARRMNRALRGVAPDDLHPTLRTLCGRLRAAAYPETDRGVPILAPWWLSEG